MKFYVSWLNGWIPLAYSLLLWLLLLLPYIQSEDVCVSTTAEIMNGVQDDIPCMAFTIDSRFPGGLANSMGAINYMADYAIEKGFRFLFPFIRPAGHMDAKYSAQGEGFQQLFGEPEVTDDLTNSTVHGCTQIIQPSCQNTRVCDGTSNVMHKLGDYQCKYEDGYIEAGNYNAALMNFDNCVSEDETATASAFYKRTGCKVVLLYDAHDYTWHFDYSHTRDTFRSRYHAARHLKAVEPLRALAPFRKFTVAIHHRKCPGTVKEMGNAFDILVLKLLARVISIDCMDVQVHTLYRREEEIAVDLTKSILALGIPQESYVLYGYDDGVDSLASLHAMVDADMLVSGTSGYPRLAAALKRSGITIAVDALKSLKDHPLDFDDVYQVPARDFMWANLENMQRNKIRKAYRNYDDNMEDTITMLLPSFQKFMDDALGWDGRWTQCRLRSTAVA